MLFKRRDGINKGLCEQQIKFLTEDSGTKRLFDSNAILNNVIENTEKYNLDKYDECMRFQQDDEKLGLLRGKYCVTIFKESEEVKYAGLCFPDSCSDATLENMTAIALKEHKLQEQWCRTTQFDYELVDYLSLAFFAFLALIILGSTLYDYFKKERKSKCLTRFSLCSNIKQVFKPSNSENVNCLYALRTLSVYWLIIANRFNTMSMFPLADEETHKDWMKNRFSVFIAASDLAYDTFFIVSGYLLTTYCLKAFAAKSMNYLHLLMHRYLRYVPLLGVAIIYYVSVFKFTVTGPLIYRLNDRIENCQHYWWTTILLVENYVTPEQTCLYDGWYFNVDFQFFVILPILVLIFFKFRKFGSVLLYTILIASCTAMITILIHSDVLFNVVDRISTFRIQSHYRCAPWIISVFLASFCLKRESINMSKLTRSLWWLATFAIFLGHFVAIYILQNEEFSDEPAVIIGAVFGGIHSILWSIAIGWIIIACTKIESTGIVRSFLNSPRWRPFGKLSVTLLIIHPLYQTSTTYCLKAPYAFDSWWTFHAGLGDIIFTTFLAIFLYASIEIPFVAIEQSFHNKKKFDEDKRVKFEATP